MQQRGIRHPARLVPLAFLAVIAIGTALLSLPFAHAGPGSAPWVTALFTAVSAICVTGLTVVDTATYWSAFGQVVILVLFQLGGLGIMAGATLLVLLVSKRLRLGTRLIAQAETRSMDLVDVMAVVWLILRVMLIVEAALTVVLTLRFHFGYGQPFGTALWNGLFHAVSAFNNAGFSTYSDSVMGFYDDALVLVPMMIAVLVGGLGFPVLHELRREPWRWPRWSVHTKITLLGTAFLFFGGALAIGAYEWTNPQTLAPMGTGERILNAMFHSVSARSSGFNTLDMGTLKSETLAVNYVLMFIGGGSASTAGGIRITTFFLLGLVVWAEVRGRPDTFAFGRTIPADVQRQALTVALLGVSVIAFGTLALMSVTELPLVVVVFEVISASATVGLSTGITGELPPSGQLMLVVMMFIGRVGPVTVATALALRGRNLPYRYPEERPIVG
ncbi:potassium transporter Trk [Lysobacter bugurensis]|uniref:Potassium transporter Trk n=1 Tax=Cognatilysobacter bugurensis TaxID=543356 RepID=A0A918SZE7_9GAMM|nr:potassium transporter Trk [Lysobacter bugurensis]